MGGKAAHDDPELAGSPCDGRYAAQTPQRLAVPARASWSRPLLNSYGLVHTGGQTGNLPRHGRGVSCCPRTRGSKNMLPQSIVEIASGAVAGIVAAIFLTAAKGIHEKYLQRCDVNQVREILTAGRKRVMESEDVFNASMNATLPASPLRCAQYNLMIRQLAIALDHQTTKLSYAKRKQIFDALDWYHTDSLHATKDQNGCPTFVILPEGRWPTPEMRLSDAVDRFNKLEAIGWLKMRSRS